MTQKSKRKRQTLNDLPSDLRGPAQNRFGGHQTQRMRALRGNTFGAANSGTKYNEEQKRAWETSHMTLLNSATAQRAQRTGTNIKQELYRWFKAYQWNVALTLTFAGAISEQKALEAAKRFWSEVDYGLFKNASRRGDKKCERVMMLEGDGQQQHFHFHGAVLTPRDRFPDDLAFCRYLENKWLKLNPRSTKIEFKPVWQTEGWSWYMTKKAAQFDCDSFDVHSSHIAAPNLLTAS